MKNVALFFTAGTTDLKFVGEDGTVLELSKDLSGRDGKATIREVHAAILALGVEGIALWPFDDIPADVPLDARGQSRDAPKKGWREKKIAFFKPDGEALVLQRAVDGGLSDFPLRRLEDGRLLMAADKMEPVFQALTAEQARLLALVGFRTERPGREEEPFMAEQLIFNKLAPQFKPQHQALITYLKGSEKLEDEASGNLLPAAIARVVSGVRKTRKALANAKAELWLATTGGIPPIKAVIRAVTELHFGPSRSHEKREGGQVASFLRAPHDVFIARRLSLELIQRGAFIEAAAHAWPFRQDKDAAYWVYPLCGAARFFDGNPIHAFSNDCYPQDIAPGTAAQAPDFLCGLARQIAGCLCVLVVLRLEAALRSEKWLEAISLSFTFYETALKDMIERKIGSFEDTRFIRLREDLAPEVQYALCIIPRGKSERPVFEQQGHLYRFRDGPDHDPVLCHFLHPAMEQFHKALAGSLKAYRNMNTHDVLGQEDVDKARARFVRARIWEIREGSVTTAFGASCVRSVLEALEQKGPNPLDRLIHGISQTLL